jgi:hypothetical protein
MNTKNNEFFYFIHKDKYVLSDTTMCSKSERTIDLQFHDIANNESLLNLLNLWYLQGDYLTNYTPEYRSKWFCNYMSAFTNDRNESTARYEKLLTNPIVRLLVIDEELFNNITKCVRT